jgi:hypothetical protein
METGVFSTWSVPRSYLEDNWGDPVSCQLRVEFLTGGCKDRTLTREAEESPLLKAVARERLRRHSRLERGLVDAVVICNVWSLALVL